MGVFKDLRRTTQLAREIERAAPPLDQRLAAATTSLREAQGTLAQLSQQATAEVELRSTGVRATGTCTAVRSGFGEINGCPVLEIDLVVLVEGCPPRPATLRAAVQLHSLHRVTPGAARPLLTEPDSGRTVLDSAALSAG